MKTLSTIFLVAAIGSGIGLAYAQEQPRIRRIAVFLPAPTDTGVDQYKKSFQEGLRALGYIEGGNINIEYLFAGDKPDQYPKFAAELVSRKPDVIVAASTPAIQALKNTTKTIPIVMTSVADPVKAGLIESLARPGGNITGLSMRSPELSGKRLELLKEVVPRVRRVGILWDPTNASNAVSFRESQITAQAMGIQLQSIEVQNPSDFEWKIKTLTRDQTDALAVLRTLFSRIYSQRIAALATKSRLPAIYEGAVFVLAGGLMSYAASHFDLWRRAATYVDKILKGAKPADLPVQQPMRVEFIINLKAAKEIGLTIPPQVLIRADKVIQ